MLELFWLLLPVAAASGWYAARRSAAREARRGSEYTPVYFKGVNYLLNEQPDKAIDVFIKLLEVDGETVETHLALGNLFRRRGEVDRAIKLHQNLIARQTLSNEQRALALLELGRDYMRAGLFDRAESLYQELTEMDLYSKEALTGLKTLYQQEREWDRCLAVAEQLEKKSGQSQRQEIAHYYCELAEQALGDGDEARATEMLERAEQANERCVRAAMLQARMCVARGECDEAIETYKKAQDKAPEYLSEILPALRECYLRQGKKAELRAYLEDLYDRHKGRAVMLALSEAIHDQDGEREAARFITGHLKRHPDLKALAHLIDLKLKKDDDPEKNSTLMVLNDLISRYLEGQPDYQCQRCGFSATKLHWQCPGCKAWGTVKPVEGVPGQQQPMQDRMNPW